MRALPQEAQLPLRIYRLLFPIVFLFFLPGALLKMIRRGGYKDRFGQRFGLYSPEARRALEAGGWTWIHAVSVGEMVMALKLARAMQEADPALRIVLSVTTTTGFALARGQVAALPRPVELIYYPLDLHGIVRRVLDLIRPERLVLVDKELWPNLVSECYRREIPITIVNARISPRSERRIRKAHRWVAPFYGLLECVCLQDEADRARWEAVGVHPGRLMLTGSLKFDQPSAPFTKKSLEPMWNLLRALGVEAGEGPVLIAGSTFPGEEEALAEAARALKERFPQLFLILAPRHVERTPALAAALRAAGFSLHLRTEPVPEGCPRPDLLIINTTGELARWYALADLCVIGKSLAHSGGQNPAEPLFAGRPVAFGPAMQNFEPLATQLVEAGGATRLSGLSTLEADLAALLSAPDTMAASVARGQEVLAIHQGATARIIGAIGAMTTTSGAPTP